MTTSLRSEQPTPRGEPTPGDEIVVGRDRLRFTLTSRQSAGELAVLDVRIPPGGGPPLLHRHDPFELYRVRSGQLAFYLEGRDGVVRRTPAGPGAVVPIAGGLEHTIRNESDEDAQAVVVFSPGEPMERFARAAGDLDGDHGPDELLALAEAHGIEVTRPIAEALAEAGEDHVQAADSGYLTIARFSGDGDRLLDDYRTYADEMAGVGRDHDLVLHACAKTDDGLTIVNLWPSKEASEAAARDPRRLAVLERADVTPDRIRKEHLEIAQFIVFD